MRRSAKTAKRTVNPKTRHALLAAALFAMSGASPAHATEDAASAAELAADHERLPLHTVMPHYPKTARRDRIEGEVQVCFEITRAGRTRRIAVRKSTNRVFEKPAIRAVRASTYVPLPKDAPMSGIKACRTFRFALEPVVVESGD